MTTRKFMERRLQEVIKAVMVARPEEMPTLGLDLDSISDLSAEDLAHGLILCREILEEDPPKAKEVQTMSERTICNLAGRYVWIKPGAKVCPMCGIQCWKF